MDNNQKKYAIVRFALGFVAISTTISCATFEPREPKAATVEARIAATPDGAPQRTITNFSHSLQCMDRLLRQYEIKNILVGAEEVVDTNAEIAGTKDMLMTALSTMSRTSRAIGVVALGQDLSDVSRYHTLHQNKNFKSPDFFIRLSAPQIDKGVEVDQIGGAIRIQDSIGIDHSRDRIASIVSLDINVGVVGNLQLIPGVYSSNSLAVIRRGSATDISGEIRKLGAVLYVNDDNSEGFHHSARTLIELGAIEVVGKLTQTPYWECLDIASTNPAVQKQIQDWYSSLSWKELAQFSQNKLQALGIYNGNADGKPSAEFSSAIARFKADQGLIADGELSYELYYQLVLSPVPSGAAHQNLQKYIATDSLPDTATIPSSEDGTDRLEPLTLRMTTRFGDDPIVFKAGEPIAFDVRTSIDAHLYCYYLQGDHTIYKLYPNRFSVEGQISAQTTVNFPDDERYSIVAAKPGTIEKIMCMAAYEDIDDKLPFVLAEKDFQKLPVAKLDQVYEYYKRVAKTIPIRKTLTLEIQ